MRLTTLVVTAAFTVVSNAQSLVINYPTSGAVWQSGRPSIITWSGNCAAMGPAGQSVTVELVNGPSDAVRIVASLGTLNCSGSVNILTLIVPNNVTPGEYAVRMGTTPASYSTFFRIDDPQTSSAMTTTTASPVTPTGPETTKSNTSDSGVSPGLIGGIIAGVVVAVVIVAFFIQRNRRGEKGGQPEMEIKSSEPPLHMNTQPQTMQGYQHYTQPQGVVTRDGVQELQQQYTFQFSNHPQPNMVTAASGEDYSSPQQSSTVWEPKPFTLPSSSSRVEPASFSQPSDPQALVHPSHPQALVHPSTPQALSILSHPHT